MFALLWGGVYIPLIAAALAVFTLLCWFTDARALGGTPLFWFGLAIFSCFLAIALIQLSLFITDPVGEGWFQPGAAPTPELPRLHDIELLVLDIGLILLFVAVYVLFHGIGTSGRDAKTALEIFIFANVVLVTATLAGQAAQLATTKFASYSHGFVNANNAASYLGILLLCALGNLVDHIRLHRPRSTVWSIRYLRYLQGSVVAGLVLRVYAVTLFLFALISTGSRAGVIVGLIAALLLMAILMAKARAGAAVNSSHRRTFPIGGLALLIAFGLIAIWIYSNAGTPFETELSRKGLADINRFRVYGPVADMILDRPLLGWGLGSFPSAFPIYRPAALPVDGWWDRAHSTYLEIGAETGLIGLALVIIAIVAVTWHLVGGIRRRTRRFVLPAIGLSVLIFVATHSLVDFPLQIPAIAVAALAVITLALCQTRHRPTGRSTVNRQDTEADSEAA